MARSALDHRVLRQFLAVAEAGSVRGGAAKLNISQPPLTQAIKRLENDLGLTLFERLPKGMTLTTAGRVLAEEAMDLLARLDRAEGRVRRTLEANPLIRIGFVSAALNGALQELLSSIEGRPVDLAEMTTPEQQSALIEGRIDVGLLHPPIDVKDLPQRSLGRDPFLAALPDRHALADRTELAFAEIATEPFVLFPREQGPSLMGAIERLAFEHNATLRVAASAPRVHSQLAIVAGGIGVGLVTVSMAKALQFHGVRFVEITDTKDRLFTELVIVGDADLIALD
ncbi:LysR family transcriptional regulator [Denitrobaculum tricleocarpae]|uniref:LysR family transcriptional regulator n=1 Tax=Denitrobaculum tricleocarpae TaxID=2591009 RepID=A0A545TQH7_9PROT|nr:LysR family transcriptional regulator [Denitrobaculum tricleocarpae]TQV79371.1 LysR family transcriptional regulator [Denitrobaculum tricleocarpae]